MDLSLILLFAVLIIFVVFTFRSNKRRKQELETLQSQMVPGAEVMTRAGIYGTIVSIDDVANEAIIESTPGTQLRVHRDALAKVVTDEPRSVEEAKALADAEAAAAVDETGEVQDADVETSVDAPAASDTTTPATATPVDDAEQAPAPRPRRRTTKKVDE